MVEKNKLIQRIFMILSTAVLLVSLFGYLIAPNDPIELHMAQRLAAPSAEFPWGTDNMGRCILSRILWGGRTTVGIVIVGAGLVIILGMVIGMLMGSVRPKSAADVICESILNSLTAIPSIAYLIVFIGNWGNSVYTMLIALVLSLLMRVVKLVKSYTAEERSKAYAICAVASGASFPSLLVRHIAPNIIGQTVRFVFMSCTDMVMSIVSFSYLGLGFGDEVVDWGKMVDEARTVIIMRPDIIVFPVLAIFASTAAFNILSSEISSGGESHA